MFQTAPRAWGWFTTSQCPAPHCSRNLTPLTLCANGHSHLPCAVVPIHAHSLVSPSPRALGEEEIQLKGAQCLHSTAGGRPRPQHDIALLMLPFSLSRLERSSSISPILEHFDLTHLRAKDSVAETQRDVPKAKEDRGTARGVGWVHLFKFFYDKQY